MFRFFKNLGIAKKIFLIPALLISLIIIQNALNINVFNKQYNTSITMKEEVYTKLQLVADIKTGFASINSDVYNLYTLLALSSVNLDKAKLMYKGIEDNQKNIEAYSDKFLEMTSNEEDKKFLKELEKNITEYFKAVDEVLSMIEVDVSIAFMYQNAVDIAYDKIAKQLEKLEKDNTNQTITAFDTAIEDSSSSIDNAYIILLLSVVLGIFLSYFISRMITVPVKLIKESMNELAQGNTNLEIKGKDSKDEVGDMARAVEVFRENAIKTKELEQSQRKSEERVKEERRAMMMKLADDFEASILGIVDAVTSSATELNSTAESMSSISSKTSEQAAVVATASEEAASNVQSVATASEQLSSSIKEISSQVANESKIAREAVEQIFEVNNGMEELSESARRIGEVVDLITDIAEQTNLLALNATIEAARAGDAGKGFAVVASEVKNLASQTAKATEDISGQINDIQSKTTNAVVATKKIGEVINSIDEISTTIASAVEEQGVATLEISNNADQVSAGTNEVSSNIGKVTQAAVEAGSASDQVLSASRELSVQASNLKDQVAVFIEKIRNS